MFIDFATCQTVEEGIRILLEQQLHLDLKALGDIEQHLGVRRAIAKLILYIERSGNVYRLRHALLTQSMVIAQKLQIIADTFLQDKVQT